MERFVGGKLGQFLLTIEGKMEAERSLYRQFKEEWEECVGEGETPSPKLVAAIANLNGIIEGLQMAQDILLGKEV